MSTYLDPARYFRYVLENPKRALKIAAVGLLVVIVTGVSLAVEAVPLWIAGYVIGGVVLALSTREIDRLKLLGAASEDDAGGLTPGPTKVHGTVVQATDDLIETPGGTECVAYEYEKVRQVRGGDRDRQRHTDSGAVPFYVEDGSGQALIDPGASRLELKHDEGSRLTMFANRAEEESYLLPGDEVNVYGEGVEPDVSYDGSSVTERADASNASESAATSDGQPATGGEGAAGGDSGRAASGGQPASSDGQPTAGDGRPAADGNRKDVDKSQFTPFPDEMEIPAEHLPDGVDSPEELIDEEDLEPPEDMPPQYQEFYREQLQQGGFPGVGGVPESVGTDSGDDEDGGMLRGMAETASDLPHRYAHLFADEDLIVGPGTEYSSVVITDKGDFRLFGKQLLFTVGVILAGLAITGISAAAMLGLLQLG